MTRVLLFGASGFLGRHVRQALELDQRSTVSSPGRRRHDLVDGTVAQLTELVAAEEPEAVVNCTGRLTGGAYDLIQANTAVTAKLVEAVAVGAPGARLVRLGSAGEYGPVPRDRPVAETDPPNPVSEYGLSHLAGTRLVEMASADGRVDGVVLRVFNPIGPGLHTDNLLGRAALLVREALVAGSDGITLGSLAAYRDFVDVRDVARAVVAAVFVPSPAEPVINVGSGVAVQVREAVALLAEAAGFRGAIRESGGGPRRSATVEWIQADIGRAALVLDWVPAYTLADSVKAILAASGDRPVE
jgi:nucleoside-diphosphate-sugar epimerase